MDQDERWAHGVEPQTLAFLQTLATENSVPMHTLPVAAARQRLATLQHTSELATKAPVTQEMRVLNAGPTGQLRVRILRPRGNPGRPLPGIIYLHGGGWMLGDYETHERLLGELVNGTQSVLVFVEYDRAPEARYPLAIEQAYSATQWVATQGAAIGVDPSRLAVVGDGSGGTLAAAVTLLAKERHGPPLSFQVLFYPVINAAFDTDSYRHFGSGAYGLSTATMQWFWESYTAPAQQKAFTASPLQATLTQLQGLPPALIISAEYDPLRDEGEAYVHKLIQAGVTVTATRYLGTIHDFVLLNALAQTPAARAALAKTTAALRNAFAR